MALHPNFPASPYAPLLPDQRWFPADEDLRSTAYEKLLPPLVAKVRKEVFAWRDRGYPGASPTSEAATTEIARNRDAQGFPQNKQAARAGGSVAGNARRELETKSGRKVVTSENDLACIARRESK